MDLASSPFAFRRAPLSAPLVRAGALALALSILAPAGAAQAPVFLGATESPDVILAELADRHPRRLRQVGTSSVTLRVDLGRDLEAAFKPRSRTHPRGYLAEIAAYRIARVLGMDNVPPVVGRRLPRPAMEARFESAHRDADWEAIRQDILWDAPGVVRGAAIYWIPRMRESELQTARDLSKVEPWLAQSGAVPAERETVARDLSTMIAFDYLIGNWDRWSGGNVSTNAEGDRLFVRDHNVAFHHPILPARYDRLRRQLERVERFSRSFVQQLSQLDEARIRLALADDPEASEQPILEDGQIGGVLARRRALLSYIGALVETHGAERVLAWE